MEMKKKDILFSLKQIEQISKFQQERITNKKSFNKEIILREALSFIIKYAQDIEGLLK